MPTNTNPEIEAALDDLAGLVCQSITGSDPSKSQDQFSQRKPGLLKTLVMSGYSQKDRRSLITDLESRVKSQCGNEAMHRGGSLSSMSSKLNEDFEEMARWESNQPMTKDPPKAANISSATNA